MMNNEMPQTPPPPPPQPPPPLPLPPLPEKRVWGAWPTIGYSAVVITGFFVAQFLAMIVALIIISVNQPPAIDTAGYDGMLKYFTDLFNKYLGLLQSIATIFSGIVGVFLIWIFVRVRKRAGFGEYLGLHKMSARTILLALGVVIAFLGLMTLVEMFLGTGTGNDINNDIYKTSVSPVLFGIAVIIFAPLFEEALFRGFLFEGLRQSRLGIIATLLITSVTWAALHIQYNIFGIAYIFILGIIIGLVRWKTKNIWTAFIMHALINLIATVTIVVATRA
jgi:uncharacterized protein